MAKARIPRTPSALCEQFFQVSVGIAAEPNWPSTAPPKSQADAHASNLTQKIAAVKTAKAQYDQARAALYAERDAGLITMKRFDEVTDGLYGAHGVEKYNYGLPPKKSTSGTSVPLVQVVIRKIEDGTNPASIFINWDSEKGTAAYQVEWYLNASVTGTPVGNAAVSESEYEITGLVAKQQYWIRVRAIRGKAFGPWSDPATRVANI